MTAGHRLSVPKVPNNSSNFSSSQSALNIPHVITGKGEVYKISSGLFTLIMLSKFGHLTHKKAITLLRKYEKAVENLKKALSSRNRTG